MNEQEAIKILEKADNLQKLTLATNVRNNLYFLAKEILGYKEMTERTHKKLCLVAESLILDDKSRILEELNQDSWDKIYEEKQGRDWKIFKTSYDIKDIKKRFRLILMPRGSFKTSCVTIGFVLDLMLHNADIRILIDSETFDKSRAFLQEIKGHLESNEKYREIFKIFYGVYPDCKKASDKWSDTELNIPVRSRKMKEPTVSCAGIGVTKVGMHYDVIIADDLHSEKNVSTREQIEQVVTHYKLFLNLLEPHGIMLIIGTRWDYGDLYQYIIDNETNRFLIFARQAILPNGELLFPERLTQEFLDDQKMSQGSYIFSNQYQNLPIDDETAVFKFSQLKRVEEDYIKGMPINWFMTVDPAISLEKDSDFTAIVVAGFDGMKNLYVRHITCGKMLPNEIISEIFRLYEIYKPRGIGIETTSFQKTLQYALNDEMKKRGWWLPVSEIKRKTTQSKENRIRGLEPYYEFGHVYHLNNCHNIDDLEYELLHFPKGVTDDIIDALADILEIGYPPGKRQVESSDKKEKKRRLFKLLIKPRSNITRY